MKNKFLLILALASVALTGCTSGNEPDQEKLAIVTSTPLVADLVRNVAGEDANVTSLVPIGADPHNYEPPLRAVRDVAWADIAFTNGLLLESGAITHTLETSLPPKTELVSLGDKAPAYGGNHIRLVEDFALSTVWLGFRSDHLPGPWQIKATSISGPGDLAAFTTGTFGAGRPYIVTKNGFDDSDAVSLPPDAHTHMSWAFNAPGVYVLELLAEPLSEDGTVNETPVLAQQPVRLKFAVGVKPDSKLIQLDSGHVDISATPQGIKMLAERGGKSVFYDPAEVVVVVPNQTLTKVPSGDWSFLGRPGEDTWILAQAVLGEHIHGEIDPHLWHNIKNAIAYVDIITEKLIAADPKHAEGYLERATEYRNKLEKLDHWAESTIASIPAENQKLVTAHDAFGYLSSRYGLEVTGFVAPNPSIEPSSRDMSILIRQLRDLRVPAVFEDTITVAHQEELEAAARSIGVKICPIFADNLTEAVPSYISMMQQNISSLKRCLDPTSLPAWSILQPKKVLEGNS